MLDECHKAKTIDLDENGKATNVGRTGKASCSRTAAAVVELQTLLPRARVVYCSATSVTEPRNLGFMSRLGLWGPGTEHPSGFNQFLQALDNLGTGAMEVCVLILPHEVVLRFLHLSRLTWNSSSVTVNLSAACNAPQIYRSHRCPNPVVLGVRVRDGRGCQQR